MKILKLLPLFVLAIFLFHNASAWPISYGLWSNNQNNITITSGENASFTAVFGFASPSGNSMTFSINLDNSDYSSLYSFESNKIVTGTCTVNYGITLCNGSFSQVYAVTPSMYQNPGTYFIVLNVKDADGSDSFTMPLYVNPAPQPANQPPILQQISDQIVNESTNYSYPVSASDPDGDILNYSLVQNPLNFSINSTGFISGVAPAVSSNTNYTISVQVSDGVNSPVAQNYTLTVLNIPSPITDTTAPIVILNSPADNSQTNLTNISFNANVSDNVAVQNVSLFINGTLNQTNSSGLNNTDYIFSANLPNGTYNWAYQACDNSSNCIFSSNRTITVNTSLNDTVPPQVQFVSPTPLTNSNLTQNYIPIGVSASDSGSGLNRINIFLYDSSGNLLYNVMNSSSTFSYTIAGLQPGTYYINATAYDNAGNQNSTETRTIILSLIPPSPSPSPSSPAYVPNNFIPTQQPQPGVVTGEAAGLQNQQPVSSNVYLPILIMISILTAGALIVISVILVRKR